ARERGRSRAAAAIHPASQLLPLSSPPQARRHRKLIAVTTRRPLSRSITVASSSSCFGHQRLLFRGESERRKLQAYRESDFPLLVERLKNSTNPISPMVLRKMGRCPLTPEEAALVLAGLGRFPCLVAPNELEPFKNFSSQLAALDFIACATANVFSMTDSGS
ncbi:hypothetical protein S83_047230, partial [Arachis hypogaea]